MSEFGPSVPEEVTVEHNELKSDEEVLFSDDRIRVFHPNKPSIPKQEGIQLIVDTGKPLDRSNPANTPDVLRSCYYALAVAKVEAEGKFNSDYWANIQMNSWPDTERGVNVFGKNPQSTESWGKPVNLRAEEERRTEPLDQEQAGKIERTLKSYIPAWEKEASQITVFEDGIKDIAPDDEEFRIEADKWINRPDPWQERAVWMNDKFVLVIVKNPHLDGLHLVCHVRENYWLQIKETGGNKAWITPKSGEDPKYLQGFVESNAILLGAENILRNQFHNSEIHHSGNWGFRPLDPVSEQIGGRTVIHEDAEKTTSSGALKHDKRISHKNWQGHGPGWYAHGHLYATRNSGEYVSLPTRPMKEVPEEWKKTKPLTETEESQVVSEIQAKLTAWLNEYAKGAQIG